MHYKDRGKGITWLSTKQGYLRPRKPWRRRLAWEHIEKEVETHICFAIFILPKPKPIHNRTTVTRKIWSKSVRQYITIDGSSLEGRYTAYSPWEAFPNVRGK